MANVEDIIAVTSLLLFMFQMVSNYCRRYLLLTDIQFFFLTGTFIRFTIWSPFSTMSDKAILRVVLELTRYIIAIQLMATALRLPPNWFQHQWQPILYLVLVVLPLSSILSFIYAYLLFPHLSTPILLTIGMAVGPTDPVIISSLVQGSFAEAKIAPSLRYILLAESGINDGGAYPFVFIPIFLILQISFYRWIFEIVLLNVLLAILLGICGGWIIGKIIDFSHRAAWSDKEAYLVGIISATFLIVSSVHAYGGDGILAVFVAGIAIDSVDTARERRDQQRTINTIDYLAGVTFGFVFALILPYHAFLIYGIQNLIVFSLLALFCRRVLFIVPLYQASLFSFLRADCNPFISSIGLSVFAPVAVAALFYASDVYLQTGEIAPFHVISFVTLSSIILHGSTSILFGYLT